MKSKTTAYLLWFFLGLWGFHRFYLSKVGTGIMYLFTFGFFGIGWIIDLFTLGGQVDMYNTLHSGKNQNVNQNTNTVVVNVTAPAASTPVITQEKISSEKQVLALADKNPILTIKQIVAQTSLEMDEATAVLKKLVEGGHAKELVDPDGKVKYDLS